MPRLPLAGGSRSSSLARRDAASRLLALGLLSLLVLVAMPGGLEARATTASATARYTLQVTFTGYVRWEYKGVLDQSSPNVTEAHTAWVGTSVPFTLVNRGSRSKPNVTIRVAGNDGYPLRIPGQLEHESRTTWISLYSKPPDYRPQECVTHVRESTGTARAQSVVTLASNRLRLGMTTQGSTTFVQGTDSCGFKHDPGSCWIRTRSLGSTCLAIPETIGVSSGWWFDTQRVKLGRAFTITRRHSSFTEPPPPAKAYVFRWVLRFTPVGS